MTRRRTRKRLLAAIPATAALLAVLAAAGAAAAPFTDADYTRHVAALKKKVPKEGFTVVIQKPFVVVGDESPAMVRRRAVRTVKWAVDRLKRDYFKKDPTEILDIWLFRDKASYRKHTREVFGDNPDTPYGYYSHRHKALIMNIATGGGTLVHEIVHPFMAANFPECPAWFNEGMGSLYEQAGERGGHIVGLTNWRLAGLQKAIRARRVPSFKALTATTDDRFYNQDKGTNYAQARYLCYYLQEKGLLVAFYHAFVAAHKADPTGYKTLQTVLGEPATAPWQGEPAVARPRAVPVPGPDMDAFKKRWETFVLGLKFP